MWKHVLRMLISTNKKKNHLGYGETHFTYFLFYFFLKWLYKKFLRYFLQHWVDMKCLEFHVATSTKLKFWFCKQSVARHLLNFLLKSFLHCHNTKDEFKHMRKKKLSYLFQVFICPFGKSFLLNGISLIWNKKENTRNETWNIFINVHKGVETGS